MSLSHKPPHVKPNFEWVCPLTNAPTREAIQHDQRFWVGLLKGIADQHTSQKFKNGLMEAFADAVMAQTPTGTAFDGALSLEDLNEASKAMVAVAKYCSDNAMATFYAFHLRDLDFAEPSIEPDIKPAMRIRWKVRRNTDRHRIMRTDPRFRIVRGLGQYDD